jgi:hypothetical protein
MQEHMHTRTCTHTHTKSHTQSHTHILSLSHTAQELSGTNERVDELENELQKAHELKDIAHEERKEEKEERDRASREHERERLLFLDEIASLESTIQQQQGKMLRFEVEETDYQVKVDYLRATLSRAEKERDSVKEEAQRQIEDSCVRMEAAAEAVKQDRHALVRESEQLRYQNSIRLQELEKNLTEKTRLREEQRDLAWKKHWIRDREKQREADDLQHHLRIHEWEKEKANETAWFHAKISALEVAMKSTAAETEAAHAQELEASREREKAWEQDSQVSNTLATHEQHISNTLATH